jgi:SAM-dependent methyltransferase
MEERDCYDDPIRYDAEYGSFSRDIGWYQERLIEIGGPALELGCGTGRVLFPLAAAGIEVDGLDSSEKMLGLARQKAGLLDPSVAGRVRFYPGDMRSFSLQKKYRAALVPLNGLMHLHRNEEVLSCLTCVRRHLVPDGHFLFDVSNPLPEFLEDTGSPDGFPTRKIKIKDAWYVQKERHRYLSEETISETTFFFEPVCERGTAFFFRLRLRMFFPDDLERLLKEAGYAIARRWGDFQGSPFGPEKATQIIQAKMLS